ncbi:bifunctional 3-hydroxydecanoyl-ACP dehydratase/trans-2-decenoyl-ACP isomerase [Marinomonas mediterranea]|jgi:3-hydroxydecanoyl-[acyl-carrier-protein] dehydratase (EC 4.2.1.60)|uniref:3-hydroxydecanoyl-(Acyl-carrier-protein) dehydratase n=1 Tax=Marinomonas mediterranea (strain ATCC 700492 / JCM 21426 / NBRC 103028 / MMB-1) TaxID=717774 RepID=F2JUG2_MARM1|nr:bifunctional 3-hydroxydecanoyl-ACP dehydratase/trans-2-decenoyl-ACP isomerase [Marinomonas mediterranea]ADZ92781.1 3-hydroxydecanoyl-(acyl-carrier-protein) dehydratase [Marinomonas mediterranea MMB-1]WCN18806.1 bifunctional 3-hydroxydecanoyl-ACP dehydratase/trans-2-decenoyl-ACP isomerase [Marinomonas mediterranea MMB-1]
MQFSHSDILAMSEGGFFGEGNAQLPSDLMLMVDHIDQLGFTGGHYGRGFLSAQLAIRPDHWFFACHFKGDPVMPGCLGLDALWQLLGVFLGCSGLPGKGRALGVGNVRFSGQIYPDDSRIEYHIHVKRIIKKPLGMGIADGFVLLNDKVIYEAKDLKVGLIR